MSKRQKTYYYGSPEDDFVESGEQGYRLPEGYEWVDDRPTARVASRLLWLVGLVTSKLYLSIRLGWRVENRRILNAGGPGGYVLYCNHTQPVGDAMAPCVATFPARAYVVASPANLGIPLLGRLLPALGALPVPDTFSGMKKFRSVVSRRLDELSCIVVYPEAHVWPYYTGIRPFPATSFAFAVDNHVPAYCMTTTYQKRGLRNRPRAVAYIDGPFWPNGIVSKKEARERLRDEVHACMVERTAANEVDFIRYEKTSAGCQESPSRGTAQLAATE